MRIQTEQMVAISDANQNFSKVARMVDENGMAVILKNNQPRYVLVDFNQYEAIANAKSTAERQKTIQKTADELIDQNLEAFQELAK